MRFGQSYPGFRTGNGGMLVLTGTAGRRRRRLVMMRAAVGRRRFGRVAVGRHAGTVALRIYEKRRRDDEDKCPDQSDT